MPQNQLSQRYDGELFLANQYFDAEFCRLFWNPFTSYDGRPAKLSHRRKRSPKKRDAAAGKFLHCSHCTAAFRWPAELEYHVAYAHRGEQLNVCPITSCHRNFQFPRQLVKHQHTTGHHNWQVVCGECNKRFKHRRFLARHTAASCKRHKLELAKANEGYDGNVAT